MTEPKGSAWPGLGRLTLIEDELAVDDDVFDPIAVLERLEVGRMVDHVLGSKSVTSA